MAKPFLKWPGGKARLIDKIARHYPEELGRNSRYWYVDLFLGGGAVLLDVLQRFPAMQKSKTVVANDLAKPIWAIWRWLQVEDVEALIDEAETLQFAFWELDEQGRRDMYFGVRADFNVLLTSGWELEADKRAWLWFVSRFLFLNKTCFNGLWRVNLKGEFNNPMGNYKRPKVVEPDNLREVAKLIKNVTFLNLDFAEVEIPDRAFVYADPPYKPKTVGSHTKYVGRFDDFEQARLAGWVYDWVLNRPGRFVLASNSYFPDYFRRLYPDFEFETVSVKHTINPVAEANNSAKELLFWRGS